MLKPESHNDARELRMKAILVGMPMSPTPGGAENANRFLHEENGEEREISISSPSRLVHFLRARRRDGRIY